MINYKKNIDQPYLVVQWLTNQPLPQRLLGTWRDFISYNGWWRGKTKAPGVLGVTKALQKKRTAGKKESCETRPW
jgi:hypothetical protein